ncbi:MAG: hypothetical protein KGJ44_09860 [Betaproteobacteria bacterium]|nr:hypothetical protein [Betaproteobacteria bacterium]
MSKEKFPSYFTTVVALTEGDCFIAGHLTKQASEPNFTRLDMVRGGQWLQLGALKDVLYGATAAPTADHARLSVVALGREGAMRVFRPGQQPAELAVPRKDKTGYLEGLCVASDGALIVCGSQNEVLRYAGEQWQAIDEGLFEKFNGKNDSALFAIAETRPGTLLAVGSRGLAVSREGGGAWHTLDAPTNLDLHAVLPAGDGGAWVAGDGGTLLRLSPDGTQWQDHSDPDLSTAPFDSLALYKGTLYISAMNQLLSLDTADPQASLQPVAGPFKAGSEFHSVSACGEYLWATGDEHVYRLGPDAQWQYLLCPDNA